MGPPALSIRGDLHSGKEAILNRAFTSGHHIGPSLSISLRAHPPYYSKVGIDLGTITLEESRNGYPPSALRRPYGW